MTQASNPFITSTVEEPTAAVRPSASRRSGSEGLDQLLGVAISVTVRFGEVAMALEDILHLSVGSMIELNQSTLEPVALLINGKVIARGEVVVVDGYYGVRITEVGTASERLTLAGEARG